jgi:hypothetical protein
MKPEPAATFKDGSLYWRQIYRQPAEMLKQAECFEEVAAENDWFSDCAADFARQCRAALAQHERYHRRAA